MINWCSIDAAFRRGGLAMGLKELNQQGYTVVSVVPTAVMIDAAVNTKGQDGELLSDYMRRSLGNAIAVGEVKA